MRNLDEMVIPRPRVLTIPRLSIEIDDPVQTGAAFVATNNGVQYSVSRVVLIVTQRHCFTDSHVHQSCGRGREHATSATADRRTAW
jgi:hypothetical protein